MYRTSNLGRYELTLRSLPQIEIRAKRPVFTLLSLRCELLTMMPEASPPQGSQRRRPFSLALARKTHIHVESACPICPHPTKRDPKTPPSNRNAVKQVHPPLCTVCYHSPATPANHPKLITVITTMPNMNPSVCLSTELIAALQVAHTKSAIGVYG